MPEFAPGGIIDKVLHQTATPDNLRIIASFCVLLTSFCCSLVTTGALAGIRESKKVSTPAAREQYKSDVEKRLSRLKSQLPEGSAEVGRGQSPET